MALAANGMSDCPIGQALHMSDKTVGEYIEPVKHKFDVYTRIEAVVAALKAGEIDGNSGA